MRQSYLGEPRIEAEEGEKKKKKDTDERNFLLFFFLFSSGLTELSRFTIRSGRARGR